MYESLVPALNSCLTLIKLYYILFHYDKLIMLVYIESTVLSRGFL